MRLRRKQVKVYARDIKVGDIFYWEGVRFKCRHTPFKALNPLYVVVQTRWYGIRGYVHIAGSDTITVYR
jgi:hypothetical protein